MTTPPPQNPHLNQPPNPLGGAGAPQRFDTPVHLRCILDPAQELKRAIPLTIFSFIFFGFVVLVIVGICGVPMGGAIAIGVVAGAVIAGGMYLRMKARITRVYGEQQFLTLTPRGLVRTDGTITTDMPWDQISRLETRNSALQSKGVDVARTGAVGGVANAAIGAANTKIATGLVGRATVTAVPGGNRAQLKLHDRNGGGRTGLLQGRPYTSEQALIFPGEFEENWTRGTVGAWLRHYRPDLPLT